MTQLVEYLVKKLAENTEEIEVTQEGDVITVALAKSDMGKVIGRQVKIIKAIRTIVKAKADGKKISVEVVEKD